MNCPYCQKPLTRKNTRDKGFHSYCFKRRPKGVKLTEDQKHCAEDRAGICWANPLSPRPCHLGQILEHTNCKLNQTKEVLDVIGLTPWHSEEWLGLWQEIEELARAEEEILDMWEDEQLPVDEELQLSDIQVERELKLKKVRELSEG